MQLIAKRPVHIGGAWIQPGQPVPYGVAGFDYERADRKGLLEAPDGEDIVNPETAEAPGAPNSEPAELKDLRAQVARLTGERDAAAQALADGKIIPADALKRITEVKGVGEKLAPVILEALTAAPKTE